MKLLVRAVRREDDLGGADRARRRSRRAAVCRRSTTSTPLIATVTSSAGSVSEQHERAGRLARCRGDRELRVDVVRRAAGGERTGDDEDQAHAPLVLSARPRCSELLRATARAVAPVVSFGYVRARAHQRALREAARRLPVPRDRPARARVSRPRIPTRRSSGSASATSPSRSRRRSSRRCTPPSTRWARARRSAATAPSRATTSWSRRSARTTTRRAASSIAADEIFVSDGSKCDSGNIQEIFALGAQDRGHRSGLPGLRRLERDGGPHRGRRPRWPLPGFVYLVGNEANGFQPEPPTRAGRRRLPVLAEQPDRHRRDARAARALGRVGARDRLGDPVRRRVRGVHLGSGAAALDLRDRGRAGRARSSCAASRSAPASPACAARSWSCRRR